MTKPSKSALQTVESQIISKKALEDQGWVLPGGETTGQEKFGSFNGVLRPTILTILGVMLYLREGWVVGNAGLLGAILVILACYVITGTTAFSISSITTNVRVGSGGAFSIISQSLGLEVGGSVGIPLFLAQGLSAALYIQGIAETWMYVFPHHNRYLVVLIVFMMAFMLAFYSAKLAFRVQSFVMLGLIAALVSMFLGLRSHPVNPSPVLWGNFEDGSFWMLFAVFFPAATGIMVGASMSGSLREPRRSIPLGTLSAWGISLLVYLSVAVWYALLGTPEKLRDTSTIFAAEHAAVRELVLIGIVSSCFSAALSSLVAAPRVLQALASHRIVPLYSRFQKVTKGEPRNASLFTGVLVLATLLIGDLNAIAKILTMFFLVIYFMINFVLFIEHRLKMISFRPQFPIPSWIPLMGSLSCMMAILIINPLSGMIAIIFVLGIYFYLDSLELQTPWETVHSGIFAGIANWAAKKVTLSGRFNTKRSWKPDLLIPVERTTQLEGYYRIVRALIMPQGSIQVVGICAKPEAFPKLSEMVTEFQKEGLFATGSVLDGMDFLTGLRSCITVKNGSFFRPNTIFVSLDNRTEAELQAIVGMAKAYRMGVILLGIHPESRLGRERKINLWVRDQSPNWQLGLELANLDYSVLLSYQLNRNWGASIRVLSVARDVEDVPATQKFLTKLMRYARMPKDIRVQVEHGDFWAFISRAPRADLNIMGLSENVQKDMLISLVMKTGASCIFVLDSGNESALA